MNMKSLLPVWGLATMLLASSCTNEDDNSTWRSNDSVVFTSQISKEQSSRATIDNTWNENYEIGCPLRREVDRFAYCSKSSICCC